MITLNFYSLTEDPRKVSKTPTPAVVGPGAATSLSGTFKDPVDTFEPRVIVELGDSYIHVFNYVQISEWSKYYFVVDKEILQKGLVRLYLREDVLNTYSTEILALNAYVERTESNYKPLLADSRRTLLQSVQHTVLTPSSGTGSFDPTPNLATRRSYVVVLANFPGVTGSKIYTSTDPNRIFPGVAHIGSDTSTMAYAFTRAELEAFFQQYYATDWSTILNGLAGNSSDGIVDVIAYPFQITDTTLFTSATPVTPSMFNHSITGAQAMKLVANPYILFDFGTFQQVTTDFLGREPYSEAVLFLPYVGEVNVPMAALNNGISVKYEVDVVAGEAMVTVVDNVTGVYVKTATARLGLHVPISRTNNVEQARNGLLAGLSSINAIGGMQANPGQSLSALSGSMVKMGLNTAHYNVERPASTVARMLRFDPYVLITSSVDDSPLAYGHFVGYPYQATTLLSGLSGFAVIGEVFGALTNATGREQDEAWKLLKSGVLF